ncbi:MAG: hypothetical protein AAGE61_11910 [Pseudomonadota bacterium]
MSTLTYEETGSRFSIQTIITATLFAGVVSLGVWELWAKVFAPLYMGGALSPVGLVKSSFGIGKETFAPLFAAKSGAVGNAVANGIHLATGLIAFPLGYLLGARPIASKVAPALPWFVVGFVYGVVLYVFAMFVMAHLFAGFPPFFGFNALSQASLIGHVLVGLAIAWSVERVSA